jgi:polyisoprenoid-binding protein YceI
VRGAILAGLMLFALPAAAQTANHYVLNKDHSRIEFSISHFYVSSTKGQFNTFDGKLDVVPGAPEQDAVTIHISPASIQTDSPARDEHLRTADFFDIAKFPSASFVSTGAVPTSGKTGKLTGAFTLHGVTRPVTLAVTLQSPDANASSLQVTATGKLKRSDFGITSYPGVIGDDVALTITAQFDKN